MANFMDKDDDLDAAFVCKRVTHGVTICILYGIDDLMTRNYCVESVRRFDLKPHTSKVLGLTYHTQSPTTDLPPQQKYSSDLSLFCFALK